MIMFVFLYFLVQATSQKEKKLVQFDEEKLMQVIIAMII